MVRLHSEALLQSCRWRFTYDRYCNHGSIGSHWADSSDDYPIIKDTINLDDAVLSEIVLNIPFKVVKEGYEDEFSDEDDYEINPSFEALKDLYGGEVK